LDAAEASEWKEAARHILSAEPYDKQAADIEVCLKNAARNKHADAFEIAKVTRNAQQNASSSAAERPRNPTSGCLAWMQTSDAKKGFDQVRMPTVIEGGCSEPEPPVRVRVPTLAEIGEKAVQFYTGPPMLPVMVKELKATVASVCAFQYVTDHTACFMQLMTLLAKGVKGRFILDKANFEKSSCARQPARVVELIDAGCKVRVLKPSGAGFACMHVKTLIFDEIVVLTGSTNMSHNGFENNKEHMFRITDKEVVKEVVTDFEETWLKASKVSPEMRENLRSLSEKQSQTYAQGKNRSQSRSLSVERR
jgi:HKD family nuclease